LVKATRGGFSPGKGAAFMFDWKNPPALFPRTALHPAVLARGDALADENAEQPWCVAFSGGADSLALLLIIRAHWPRQRVVALHFNHRLRGAESDADAAFCGETCEQLGVEFRLGEWQSVARDASEAAARTARLGFFADEMKALRAAVLWTGHHQDDVAETLLMRIARGSGSTGLSAPRPVQEFVDRRVFLRPMLTLSKAAIIAALSGAGVRWREDSSNATGDFFRNRVRTDVIPAWRKAAENDALAGAALSRELLEEDDVALSSWLKELMPETEYSADTLDVRRLAGRPRALLRRALRQWTPLAPLTRSAFNEVLIFCGRGAGRISVGDGVIEIAGGILRYVAAATTDAAFWNAVGLAEHAQLFLPDGSMLTHRSVEITEQLRVQILAGRVDPAREVYLAWSNHSFRVRLWADGDRYRPLGAPGSAKLHDLFVNRKIAAARRRVLPVVIDADDSILWVPGFPPAEKSKITSDSVTAVHLTYETGTYTVRP
jgi:tRNA(Ile)-lysidine synthase